MPPYKTMLFFLGFIVCCGGALAMPFLGAAGYVLHYNLGAERQWWFAPVRSFGIRYSYMLAILTAVGIVLLAALIFNALRTLRRIMKRARQVPHEHRDRVLWMSYGLATALVAMITYGITGTLVYFEALWWLFVLPACLSRAVDNIEADQLALAAVEPRKRKASIPNRRNRRARESDGNRS